MKKQKTNWERVLAAMDHCDVSVGEEVMVLDLSEDEPDTLVVLGDDWSMDLTKEEINAGTIDDHVLLVNCERLCFMTGYKL